MKCKNTQLIKILEFLNFSHFIDKVSVEVKGLELTEL